MNNRESSTNNPSKYKQALRGLSRVKDEGVILATDTIANPDFVRKAMFYTRLCGTAFGFLGFLGWSNHLGSVDVKDKAYGGDRVPPTPTPTPWIDTP